MTDVDKICGIIGNESFDALWNGALDNNDCNDLPEYEQKLNDFTKLLEQLPSKEIAFEIESFESQLTTIAMYQGFVMGFKEAVKLLSK